MQTLAHQTSLKPASSNFKISARGRVKEVLIHYGELQQHTKAGSIGEQQTP